MPEPLTMLVCSTCGGKLQGRTCVNGHSAYPAKEIEVVPKSELDALGKFTAAVIDLLPDRLRREVTAGMTAVLAEREEGDDA